MTETTSEALERIRARQQATAESHARSNRKALLEHARMGRSVPEGGADGKVVWITPAEIFARYGLDEFGREKA
ncbi:MAG: hypothetical protein MUF18_03435 [Fimbriiglobus sp.]|jgi:hypothetical protein|nr:hypothetical protein [Fimbriiglobus sp.]